MFTPRRRQTTLLIGFALVIVPGAGASRVANPSPPRYADSAPVLLTEHGVGGLKLGRTLGAIRADHLIGRLSPGCELASPRPYFAKLAAPLIGFATFTGSGPAKRLASLSITRGVRTDRGVTIGTTAARVRRVYPGARVEHSAPPNPLEFDAIVVARAGRDRIWFMLDRRGGRVRSIDLPGPEFCE